MSDPSDSSDPTDDAWDDPPASADQKPTSGDEHRIDTVPPPASGDAYSADTVIRDVPREALDAIREKQRIERAEKKAAAKKAAEDELPKISDASDENPSAATRVARPAPAAVEASLGDGDRKTPVEASTEVTDVSEVLEEPKAKSAPPPIKGRVEKAEHPEPAPYVGPEPVTSGELLTAVAGAIIAIVAGFYLLAGML